MPSTNKREPIFTTDTDGEAVVLIPLANHNEPAKLFRDDFDRLMAEGCSDQWMLNSNGQGHAYVRVGNSNVAGQLESVARLVFNAGNGVVVKHYDGDRLNLRSDNLMTEKGYAKGQTVKKHVANAI